MIYIESNPVIQPLYQLIQKDSKLLSTLLYKFNLLLDTSILQESNKIVIQSGEIH